jgi:hypothetical protein
METVKFWIFLEGSNRLASLNRLVQSNSEAEGTARQARRASDCIRARGPAASVHVWTRCKNNGVYLPGEAVARTGGSCAVTLNAIVAHAVAACEIHWS